MKGIYKPPTEKIIKINWVAGLVDIVIIIGALYLHSVGERLWWLFLLLMMFSGSYKIVVGDKE